MTAEQWIAVPTFEKIYEVSDRGRIRKIRSKRLLKPFRTHGNGSPRVTLVSRGQTYNVTVKQLILETFLGQKAPGGMVAFNINGNRDDNHLHNLGWRWPDDANRIMPPMAGRRSYCRFDPDKVRALRTMNATGQFMDTGLAEVFGAHITTVRRILRRETWASVED